MTSSLARRAIAIIDAEARAVAELRDAVATPEFAALIEHLATCRGRILLAGIGKSGIVAQRIAASLRSVGAPALFLHPVEALHGDLGVVAPGDTALLLSRSGETRELLVLLPELRRLGVAIAAITCRPGSALAREADAALELAGVRELPGLAGFPTISTTLFQVLGDAIVALVFERRELREDDLGRLHPAGLLGKLGSQVRDAMRAVPGIPTTSPGASLGDALRSIIDGRLGMTCALGSDGRLVGVLTDGDIKRILVRHGGIDGLTVGEVMSPEPKTIAPDATLGVALERMEDNPGGPIMCLVVVDEGGRIEGVLHIHHVLGERR